MSTFEFNGISKKYLVLERSWSLPGWAPVEREYLTFPGRAGGVPVETRTGMLRFPLPIIILANNTLEKQEFIEDMARWLIHEDEKPLKFSKYPNRTLLAQIEGAPDFGQMWATGEGILNIVCADPYTYGDVIPYDFINGAALIENKGSAPAAPIYEIDVLASTTHIDIIGDGAYTRLGDPASMEQPVYERQTLVLSDSLKTLIGWSDVVNVDNGYVAGTMSATQSGFTPTAYGAEISPRKWQGPAKVKSLPRPVKNFQMIATVELLNVGKQTGMIEIYCLDAFGNTVAKVGIEDIMQSVAEVQAKFQLGNVANRKIQHYRTADNKKAWNDYKGVLRLFRDGNRFRPYFGLVQPDGKHVWVSSDYMYTDAANAYSAEITQIQIAIRKWPGTTEATMRVRDLKVWELNDPAEGVPYLFGAGDKVVIDSKESEVLLNGEEREDLADWFGDFFDLPPGYSTVLLQPTDKLSGKVIVPERYK